MIILAGCAALIVAAYVAASRIEVDGTTEVAAFIVLASGAVAGMHHLQLASATVALTTLILVEKTRLHHLVERIEDTGLHAAVRFAVMAVVILPLLPVGPYGPWGGVRPRQLWILVLFFSGLSFAGTFATALSVLIGVILFLGWLGGLSPRPTSPWHLLEPAAKKLLPAHRWRWAPWLLLPRCVFACWLQRPY